MSLSIAVEGCCHGKLDSIYQHIQQTILNGKEVELLLICGDFQAAKDMVDLNCVAVPPKYRKLNDFKDYISGHKKAPILTIFIGGNHEASNVLQLLPFGGWIAPNIFYLGYAGIVSYKGVKISGISGIFNPQHYKLPHFEYPPYTDSTLRSVYHTRELEIFRMAQYRNLFQPHSNKLIRSEGDIPIDIMLSHDWPRNVWEYGDLQTLLRIKPYFQEDITSGKLGSEPSWYLLRSLKPKYWFSGHLHVKFNAVIPHISQEKPLQDSSLKRPFHDIDAPSVCGVSNTENCTFFLALDKIPEHNARQTYSQSLRRDSFIEYLNIPLQCSCQDACELSWDIEWLSIIKHTYSFGASYNSNEFPRNIQFPRSFPELTVNAIEQTAQQFIHAYGSWGIRQQEFSADGLSYADIGVYWNEYAKKQTIELLSTLQLEPYFPLSEMLGIHKDRTSDLVSAVQSPQPRPPSIIAKDCNEIDLDDL